MRPYGLIVAPKVMNDCGFSFSHIFIAALWHPLGFKASKEAFCRHVVPEEGNSKALLCPDARQELRSRSTFSAHTVGHAMAISHRFCKCLIAIMATLIGMKQHPIRL